MNKKTTTTQRRPAHSGFEAEPPAGATKAYPQGTRFKLNKDGTHTPIYPKGATKKK